MALFLFLSDDRENKFKILGTEILNTETKPRGKLINKTIQRQ